MKTTTANFDSENANEAKQPVFIVEFSGLTRKYCTGTFSNITANHKKYIADFHLNPTRIDTLRNSIAIGKGSFRILDQSFDASDLIISNNFHNLQVTIKFGFQTLSDSDFIDFDNWKITEIQPNEDRNSITFFLEDASRLVTKTLGAFEQNTNLNGNHTAAVTTITVDSTTGFIDPANIPSEIRNYIGVGVRIDDEIIAYTGVTATTFTGAKRQSCGTDPVAHDDNAPVTQAVVFHNAAASNPFNDIAKCVLHTLLTTDDASGHAYYDLATYDSNFKHFGFGYTTGEVNIETIEKFGYLTNYNSLGTTTDHTNVSNGDIGAVHESINGFELMEDTFLNPLGAFWYTDTTNKVALGTFDSTELVTNFASVATLDDGDKVNFRYEIDWRNMVNVIEIESERNAVTGSTIFKDSFKLDESVTDYGENENPLKLNTGFFRQQSTASNFVLDNYLRRWFYAFGNPPARWEFSSLTKNITLDPGDHIKFDSVVEVDLTGVSASRGWTGKEALIEEQDIRLSGGDNPVFDVKYKGFIFNILDKVSGYHTDTTVLEASIDDTSLDFTGSDGTALEAADAYVDFGTTQSAQAFRFRVEVTQPNSGSSHHLFKLRPHIQSPAGTDTFAPDSFRYIRYFTGNGDTIVYDFFVIHDDGNVSMDRFKVDAFELRDTSGGAVAGAETPTLKFSQLIYSTLDKAISAL